MFSAVSIPQLLLGLNTCTHYDCICMNECMYVLCILYGQTDGWIDGCTQMYVCIYGWMYVCLRLSHYGMFLFISCDPFRPTLFSSVILIFQSTFLRGSYDSSPDVSESRKQESIGAAVVPPVKQTKMDVILKLQGVADTE